MGRPTYRPIRTSPLYPLRRTSEVFRWHGNCLSETIHKLKQETTEHQVICFRKQSCTSTMFVSEEKNEGFDCCWTVMYEYHVCFRGKNEGFDCCWTVALFVKWMVNIGHANLAGLVGPFHKKQILLLVLLLCRVMLLVQWGSINWLKHFDLKYLFITDWHVLLPQLHWLPAKMSRKWQLDCSVLIVLLFGKRAACNKKMCLTEQRESGVQSVSGAFPVGGGELSDRSPESTKGRWALSECSSFSWSS